jgi:N-acetyl-beta-hexosaminidase
VYCTKDSTFQFLQDVLTEVMDLFPGKYIHIGGDECPKTRWKTCSHCQSLIKKEKLMPLLRKGTDVLKSYRKNLADIEDKYMDSLDAPQDY